MATIRLNHPLIQKKMAEKFIRPTDLAKKLGVSKQMVFFILNKGGYKYVDKLAAAFDCRVSELLIVWPEKPMKLPKGYEIINRKVRKKGE
jgi:DNA-binding Xre family transcriptional regulator